MKNTFWLLFAFPIILLFTCSSAYKDADVNSVKEILVIGPWVKNLEFEDIDLDGTFVAFGDDCGKDNPWHFREDGTLRQSLGIELCDPQDDPSLSIQSNWELQDNEKTLVLHFFADDIKFHINSFSDYELLLFLIEPDNPAGVYTHQVILSR